MKSLKEIKLTEDVKEFIVKLDIIDSKREILNAISNTIEKKTNSLTEETRDELDMGLLNHVRNVESAVNFYWFCHLAYFI